MLTYAMLMVERYLPMMKREEGQGMAEYGLILALIAVAAIVAFQTLGGSIDGVLGDVGSKLDAAVP